MEKIKKIFDPATHKDDAVLYGTGEPDDRNLGKITGEGSHFGATGTTNTTDTAVGDPGISKTTETQRDIAEPPHTTREAEQDRIDPTPTTQYAETGRDIAEPPRTTHEAEQHRVETVPTTRYTETQRDVAEPPLTTREAEQDRIDPAAATRYTEQSSTAPLTSATDGTSNDSTVSLKSGVPGAATGATLDTTKAPHAGSDSVEFGQRWDPDADIAATTRRAQIVSLASSRAEKGSQQELLPDRRSSIARLEEENRQSTSGLPIAEQFVGDTTHEVGDGGRHAPIAGGIAAGSHDQSAQSTEKRPGGAIPVAADEASSRASGAALYSNAEPDPRINPSAQKSHTERDTALGAGGAAMAASAAAVAYERHSHHQDETATQHHKPAAMMTTAPMASKTTHEPATAPATTTVGQGEPQHTDAKDEGHHYGRDAAIGGGAAVAGGAAAYAVDDEAERKRLEKEREQAEKDQKKAEKEHGKEVKKAEKEHEKEVKKVEKEHEKEVKKAEKEEKKAEKEHEKEIVAAQKEQEKAEKERVKEEEKRRKEAEEAQLAHEKRRRDEEEAARKQEDKRRREEEAAAGAAAATGAGAVGAYEYEKHKGTEPTAAQDTQQVRELQHSVEDSTNKGEEKHRGGILGGIFNRNKDDKGDKEQKEKHHKEEEGAAAVAATTVTAAGVSEHERHINQEPGSAQDAVTPAHDSRTVVEEQPKPNTLVDQKQAEHTRDPIQTTHYGEGHVDEADNKGDEKRRSSILGGIFNRHKDNKDSTTEQHEGNDKHRKDAEIAAGTVTAAGAAGVGTHEYEKGRDEHAAGNAAGDEHHAHKHQLASAAAANRTADDIKHHGHDGAEQHSEKKHSITALFGKHHDAADKTHHDNADKTHHDNSKHEDQHHKTEAATAVGTAGAAGVAAHDYGEHKDGETEHAQQHKHRLLSAAAANRTADDLKHHDHAEHKNENTTGKRGSIIDSMLGRNKGESSVDERSELTKHHGQEHDESAGSVAAEPKVTAADVDSEPQSAVVQDPAEAGTAERGDGRNRLHKDPPPL